MIGRTSVLLVGLAVLVTVSLSCENYDSALDGSSGNTNAPYITDGTQTNAFPSVGYLENGGIFCTATLIGPRAVLTAAHCIGSSSGSFTAGGKNYRWSKAHVHPNYNSGTLAHDVAVVILNNNVSGLNPSPINTSAVSRGQKITLVGFGYTNNNGGNSSGKKYVGANSISNVNATELHYRNNSTICNGDSGGPTFIGSKVVGVHSWGQGSGKCTEGTGGDKRVDYYASWITSKADVSTVGGDDEGCSDSNNYADPQGFECADWVGYDCTRAAEDWGYSNAEEQEIIANCQQSCELCDADGCPDDPNKTAPGICGCGTPDTDSDGDGTVDCKDNCPSDPDKTKPGECGCGKPEGTCDDSCQDRSGFTDAQGFSCADWVGYDCKNAKQWGYSDAEQQEIIANCPESCELCSGDNCPNDPNKTEPGICGCGTPDTDRDGDGTADCKDNCPSDPDKTEPGECGCGKPEGTCNDSCEDRPGFVDAQGFSCAGWVGYDCTNTEQWGYSSAEEREIIANCPKSCEMCSGDNCPSDPNKTEPGICGCGTPDTDSDRDGAADCQDNCLSDPDKTEPGECGCGKPEGTCDDTCENRPGFVDAQGFSCADWVGYDCNNAGNWGYSSAEQQELKANCPVSCELCEDDNNNDGSPTIGGYSVYFGMLHSHTGVSDGAGTPATAYKYARDTAGLDFFSIADHDYYPNDMTDSDWSKIRSAANSYNEDGKFVAFWGFEWTSDSSEWQSNGLAQGHITIINSDDYCISSYQPTRTLDQLTSWLSNRNAVAFFNHPGQYGTSFNNYDFNYSDKIVGMELWNRSEDYYSSGHYDKALKKGWYIGATGSQDNHSADWGTANEWRMAILADKKTRAALLSAMKARRFYSSRDKNLALSFKCNDAEMGSIVGSGTLNCKIQATDGNNEKFSRIELLKNGSVVKTWTPNSTKPVVQQSVVASNGDYFYVRVYQSSKWDAISSPIFAEN